VSDRLLFSVAGARGIVGKTIDTDVVTRLTRAFSAVLPPGPVAVGRDTRPSGASFLESVAAALTGDGRDVIDAGIASTPTVELVTERTDAVAGVIVTASHNPVEWNALKFLDGRGIFIGPDLGAQLLGVYESNNLPTATGGGNVHRYPSASSEHIDAILGLDVVDVGAIAKKRFKVVLDCINGAGSTIVPDLLERLGCETVRVNCKTDGDFFRDPEPRPDNLRELAERVSAEGADIGFATDPDADRLALVDDNGVPISEEYTLALAVDHVLSRHPGNVVVNLSTSSLIDHVAARHGARVLRTPVGEAHVVGRMLATGAVIGGEGNGGVIYPALHPGRDAPLGVALILQLLAGRNLSLSEQIREYPPFCITKSKLALGGPFDAGRISRLTGSLGPDTIDAQDGVKALFSDRWVHLRVSNTEGVVRVIAEAPDEEGSLALQQQARDILARSWGSDG
jgi:phosphomannomutase